MCSSLVCISGSYEWAKSYLYTYLRKLQHQLNLVVALDVVMIYTLCKIYNAGDDQTGMLLSSHITSHVASFVSGKDPHCILPRCNMTAQQRHQHYSMRLHHIIGWR